MVSFQPKLTRVAFFHTRTDLHLARKIWHCLMGCLMAGLYVFVFSREQALLLLGSFFLANMILESLRLKHIGFNAFWTKLWSPLLRQHETTGLTTVCHYLAAVILSIALFPKEIAVLSILYLAFGDPLASTIGILYGKKGPRFSSGKTWIGTAAGVSICVFLTWFYLGFLGVSSWSHKGLLSLLGGASGGAAEHLPFDMDDNFVIPLVSSFALWFFFQIIGFF